MRLVPDVVAVDLPGRNFRNIQGAGRAWRHAPLASRFPNPGKILRRSRARYCILKKWGRVRSVPGRKTTAQDLRRIQAIFRRGDVDKKEREKIRANPPPSWDTDPS